MEHTSRGALSFRTPEEEIAYLRRQLEEKERTLKADANIEALHSSADRAFREDESYAEKAGMELLKEYEKIPTEHVLAPEREEYYPPVAHHVERISSTEQRVDEIVGLARAEGIKRSLDVLSELQDDYITDEVHRRLIEEIRTSDSLAGVKDDTPLWRALHMSLFEVALPHDESKDKIDDIRSIFSAMEKFLIGMQNVGYGARSVYYTIEIAVKEGSDEIIVYIAVPTASVNIFEKHILSLFPQATLIFQPRDYNIFSEDSRARVSVAKLTKHPIYPLAALDTFVRDPMDVIINSFSKIQREGEGAALQFVISADAGVYKTQYEGIVKDVRRGDSPKDAIQKSTIVGSLFNAVKTSFFSSTKDEDEEKEKNLDQQAELPLFERKTSHQIADVNIRIVSSAKSDSRAEEISLELKSAFSQFSDMKGNEIAWKTLSGKNAHRELKAYSFREFNSSEALPLSFEEIALLIHFPKSGKPVSAQLKQAMAKRAPAPLNLPRSGTLLGVNAYRGIDTMVYVTPEDRLRHFYIIGQTGTGKTTLMKNMVVQDIIAGNGVCMIDPHGSDIADIMGSIPKERFDDVIYFDPSNMERVMGLNMLEYDYSHPEQKTFVVNELFSIFKKLYSANPEAMGPMFEQYFRNAALLILEDPESGSTLLDISRVMVDAEFRAMKLSRARNPVVVQFWNEIATKAGGEASLENIVPYIVSKIDTFTANDYMRPIIGQQKSSFNFREIMDNKKILLVNLSKGRIGEINANLIGMIIVGKILMAALSRVDDQSRSYPPFYLHMDEFQNITTDSISAILSEARKYKLGLTVAHQFIAQLDQRIRDAVFGNVGNIAAFRVGADDAEYLSKQFAPEFTAQDLITIENRNAYVRILADGTPTQPFNIETMAFPPSDAVQIDNLIRQSSSVYGKSRAIVDAEISLRYL